MTQKTAPKKPLPGWAPFALVVATSFLFGLFVLPRLDGAGSASPLEGESAPEFVLPVTHGGPSGNRIRLSNLSGRVVLIDFWASWCGPCLEQIPILSDFAQATEKEAVSVIGVNTGDEPEAADKVLNQLRPVYPSLRDDGSVAAAYQVRTLPTLVVVSPSGKVTSVLQGVHPREELETLVRNALQE